MLYWYYFFIVYRKFYTQVVLEIAIKFFFYLLRLYIFGGQKQDVKPEARKTVVF